MCTLSRWNFNSREDYDLTIFLILIAVRNVIRADYNSSLSHRYEDTCIGDDNSHLSPFTTLMEAKQISLGWPGPPVSLTPGGSNERIEFELRAPK
jgi:hypothetical protein